MYLAFVFHSSPPAGGSLTYTAYHLATNGNDYKKQRARIEIQPRFKIQYPMKNRSINAGAVF